MEVTPTVLATAIRHVHARRLVLNVLLHDWHPEAPGEPEHGVDDLGAPSVLVQRLTSTRGLRPDSLELGGEDLSAVTLVRIFRTVSALSEAPDLATLRHRDLGRLYRSAPVSGSRSAPGGSIATYEHEAGQGRGAIGSPLARTTRDESNPARRGRGTDRLDPHNCGGAGGRKPRSTRAR